MTRRPQGLFLRKTSMIKDFEWIDAGYKEDMPAMGGTRLTKTIEDVNGIRYLIRADVYPQLDYVYVFARIKEGEGNGYIKAIFPDPVSIQSVEDKIGKIWDAMGRPYYLKTTAREDMLS